MQSPEITMHTLRSAYGLSEAAAYRAMAEFTAGASLSTAVDIALTQTVPLPAIYGWMYPPPTAYDRSGALIVLNSGPCTHCGRSDG